MDAKVKRKWLKALRSGEYKQARNKLNNGVGFCCLGVLCDLHAKETGRQWEHLERRTLAYLGSIDELPSTVRKWAGLTESNPAVGQHSLAAYNDGSHGEPKRHTFAQIAELIKAYL